MKCPYQTKVIHQPEYTEGYTRVFAQDVTMFSKCLENECPFYCTTEHRPTRRKTEHCRRAESEEVNR